MNITTINFKNEYDFLKYLREVATHKTMNRNGFFVIYRRAYLNKDWDRMVKHAQSLKAQGFLSALRVSIGKQSILFKFPPPAAKPGYPRTERIERKSDPMIETLVDLWNKSTGGE